MLGSTGVGGQRMGAAEGLLQPRLPYPCAAPPSPHFTSSPSCDGWVPTPPSHSHATQHLPILLLGQKHTAALRKPGS